MAAKDNLLQATRELLWERGYEATSPRHILDKSGAGQGSLYHHFSGKADLVGAALKEVEQEMRAQAEAVFRSDEPPLARIEAYLQLPREALKGCRLGRLACEPSTIEHEEIRTPLRNHFAYVRGEMTAALQQLQDEKRLPKTSDVDALAAALVAAVQGGYVLARASGDTAQMAFAVKGAMALLRAAVKR